MTKSLIEEAVAQNVVVPCAACRTPDGFSSGLADNMRNQMGPGPNGTIRKGRRKGLYRRSMPFCRLCKGRGWVYADRICECGLPALFYDEKEKAWSCGDSICLAHAVFRKQPGTDVHVYPGWGMGG